MVLISRQDAGGAVTAQTGLTETIAARVLSPQARQIDQTLPEWARRSNPIVRRQLGLYWKVMPPDASQIMRLYLYQAAFVGVSLFIPFLLTFLMPAATVSLVALPVALVVYGVALVHIAIAATVSMVDEGRNGSLDLLRACPRPLNEILYSKAAASIWRQIESLGPVLVVAVLCSLPVLIILYDQWMDIFAQPVVTRIGVILALGSCVARVMLDAALVAAVGIAVGSVSKQRTSAILTTILLMGAYFLAINLLRLPDWDILPRMIVEIALPTLAPIVLIPLAFRMTVRTLERG